MDVPTDRDIHTTSLKVRFYELDPYDHVNHTNYFSYFETARIEYLVEMGLGLDVMKAQGWQLVVVEVAAKFQAAAKYGEELTIRTWVGEVGRVKSTWHQKMTRAGETIARLTIVSAFTDLEGNPRRIPEHFADRVRELI